MGENSFSEVIYGGEIEGLTVGLLDGLTVGLLDGWTFGRLDFWTVGGGKSENRRFEG